MWQTLSGVEEEEPKPQKNKDEALEDEIARITAEVDRSLKIGDAQKQWLEKHLVEKHLSQRQGAPERSPDSARDGQRTESGPNQGPVEVPVTKSERHNNSIREKKSTNSKNGDASTYVGKGFDGITEDEWEDVQDSSGVEST